MNGAVRIKIGASLDRSVDTVFQSVEKRAKRAQDTISRAMAGSGKGGPYRTMQRDAETAYTGIGNAAARAARQAERETQRSLKAQARAYKQLGDIAARELGRAHREQERSGRSRREVFARRFSGGVMRNTAGAARWSTRAAGDLARGAGVDFSLANSISRAQSLGTGAVNLSNAGFMAGKSGPAGVRQDPMALIAEARRVGDVAGIAPGDAMAGLQGFVKSTGDLATGRAVLEDMARLSKATGANLDEMVAAAGKVSVAFGDAATSEEEAKKRAEQVADVMRVITGQGKLGTVEISDLATQMAKLSASATQFAGDRGKNIATMGALGQLAQEGGASSPQMQATSVSAFVNTLKTPARRERFKEYGVGLDAAGGKLRDPQEIIIDAIKAAGEDADKWKRMFGNVQGERGLTGLRTRYLEAGGGATGEAAVRAKFTELGSGAAIGRDEEAESFRRSMETGATKAQQFQNELDRVAENMAGQVLPALQKLGPSAISLATTLGNVATWTAANPKIAIGLAIGASIAQAGIGALVRGAIEAALKGGAGMPGAPGSSALGAAGAALAITAAAVTITAAGVTLIDQAANWNDQAQRDDIALGIRTQNLENSRRAGNWSPEKQTEAAGMVAELKARIASAKAPGGTFGKLATLTTRGLGEWIGGKSAGAIAKDVRDSTQVGDLESKLERLESVMRDAKNGVQQVRVINADDFASSSGPGINPETRAPASEFRMDLFHNRGSRR